MRIKLFFVPVLLVSILNGCSKKSDSSSDSKPKLTLKGSGAASDDAIANKQKSANNTSGTDTGKAMIKVYKFAVSKNQNCSEPKVIFSSDEGKLVNMNEGPTIGEGEIESGEYPCVIFEMSDTITFTSKEDNGSCKKDQEYTINVCRGYSTSKTYSTLIDGTRVECTDNDERVGLYISTLSSLTTGEEDSNAFEPPTTDKTTNGIKLSTALVVSENKVGTFIMDTRGKVTTENDQNEQPSCGMQPPAFSFK